MRNLFQAKHVNCSIVKRKFK